MKKYILLSFVLLNMLCSFAQTNPSIDPRITEVYGSYATEMAPDQMTWLQVKLQRSEIKKLPFKADEQLPKISGLKVMTKFVPTLQMETTFDPLKINPLKYYIDYYSKTDQIFRIDGTDFVLLIKKKE